MAADRSSPTRVQTVARGLVPLMVLLALGGALVSCSSREPTAATSASPTTTESQKNLPPFETPDGFAWIAAACGGPSLVDASPNSWLPNASPVALCVTPAGRAPVLVGVYNDPSAGTEDAAKIQGQRGYATRNDDQGRTWIFVVEGTDPTPLKPLERYGFVVR